MNTPETNSTHAVEQKQANRMADATNLPESTNTSQLLMRDLVGRRAEERVAGQASVGEHDPQSQTAPHADDPEDEHVEQVLELGPVVAHRQPTPQEGGQDHQGPNDRPEDLLDQDTPHGKDGCLHGTLASYSKKTKCHEGRQNSRAVKELSN